jgi:hypothetical protein
MPYDASSQIGRVKAAATFFQFIYIKGGSNGSGS